MNWLALIILVPLSLAVAFIDPGAGVVVAVAWAFFNSLVGGNGW